MLPHVSPFIRAFICPSIHPVMQYISSHTSTPESIHIHSSASTSSPLPNSIHPHTDSSLLSFLPLSLHPFSHPVILPCIPPPNHPSLYSSLHSSSHPTTNPSNYRSLPASLHSLVPPLIHHHLFIHPSSLEWTDFLILLQKCDVRRYGNVSEKVVETLKGIVGAENVSQTESIRSHHSVDESYHKYATSLCT